MQTDRPRTVDIEEDGTMDEESVAPGTPVFRVSSRGSYVTVAFLPDEVEEADARVFHAVAEQHGDFRRLMNEVCVRWFNGDPMDVVFSNVISEELDEALAGFDSQTITADRGPFEGEEYEELVGTWDPGKQV